MMGFFLRKWKPSIGRLRSPSCAKKIGNLMYVANTFDYYIAIFDIMSKKKLNQINVYDPIDLLEINELIYVVSRLGCSVYVIDKQGAILQYWGRESYGNERFCKPMGIASNGSVVFIVDSGNDKIKKFDLGGNLISE